MVVSKASFLVTQCRPITCIEVTNNYICICEGPGLIIFDKNRNVISRKVIFPLHKTVLGISVCQIFENPDLLYIFAFGINFSQLYYFSALSQEIQLAIDFKCTSETVSCVNNTVTYLAAKWLNNGLHHNELKLAAITDENVLHLWNWGNLFQKKVDGIQTITCSKVRGAQTSLFSATLSGPTDENLIVFSGTNLSSILVWAPQDKNKLYHILLEGLKGSVLSLRFCYKKQILVASTDQRSVFAWKFNSLDSILNSFGPNLLIKNKVTIHQIAELVGHTGRVWQVDISGNNIVSSGQDGNIFLWDTKGNLVKVWSGSTPISVRCCRFDPLGNSVVSGADDGSVYQWKFSSKLFCNDKTISLNDNSSQDGLKVSAIDYPRQVICYNVNTFIVSMNSGKFFIVDKEGNQKEIFSNTNLSFYNMFAVSPDRKHIAIGSKNGHLYFLKIRVVTTDTRKPNLSPQHTAGQHYQLMTFDSKVMSLDWLTGTRLVTSTYSHVYILENQNDAWVQSYQFQINWKDRPGVSEAISVVIDEETYLIMGDELGSVHLFKLGQEGQDPLFSLQKLHGTYGVCNFKLGVHENEIWSVGRNTSIVNLKIEMEPQPHLVIVQVVGSCLNWNSKLVTTKRGSYICGFSENDFVIIDGAEDKIAKKFPCGGAHRCWDIAFGDLISFAFIRHKQFKLSQFDLDSITLKTGFYGGKTMNAVVNCPFLADPNSKSFCVLTGGEDGILRLSAIKSTGMGFNDFITCKLAKFKGHASSVRTINYHHFIEESSLLVFSGGGRSQIVASWIESRGHDTAWSKKSTIMLQNKQLKTSNPDMRIMNIDKNEIRENNTVVQFLLLCACSDGSLYQVSFNVTNNKFVLLKTFILTPKSGLSHSISSVSIFEDSIYCSNSIGDIMIYSRKNPNDKSTSLDLDQYQLYRNQTNSCAITALEIIPIPSLGNLIVTGSDDGVLKISLIVQVGKVNSQIAIIPIHEDREHHSSAINSICVCQNRIFATSADQVVTFRRLDGQNVVVLRCGVSDVQDMTVLQDHFSPRSALILLGGQGFEILRVNCN